MEEGLTRDGLDSSLALHGGWVADKRQQCLDNIPHRSNGRHIAQ